MTTHRRALVVGKFLPPHLGHHHLVELAARHASAVDVVVCDLAGQAPAANRRARWLTEVHPGAAVHVVTDICGWHAPRPCPDGCSAKWARHLQELGLGLWDLVVTSEAYGGPFARYLGAEHLLATAIWHERLLGEPAPHLIQRALHAGRQSDLYVLTSPAGVPFEQDGLRDGEQLREWMTARFRDELAASGIEWMEVSGSRGGRVDEVLERLARFPNLFGE